VDLYILDVGRIRMEHREEEAQKDWMQVLMEYIDKRLRAQDFDLLAIDPLSGLYSLSDMKNPRRDLFHFFSFLKELGPTSFLISEIPYGSTRIVTYEEDFLADGIFLLRHHEMGESGVQLRLRCVKMRKTRHEQGYFALIRAENRFMVTSIIAE
jgi:KaiC/GvpD/RAD55 family RecA-like ATPase